MTSPHDARHEISLAIWDLTSPVVVGRRATLKVGVSCSAGCDLTATRIEVYNHEGARVGSGAVGPEPWPATTALYWAELDIAPPDTEGDQWWSIRATTPSHNQSSSIVRFAASKPPEHCVTVEVIDKGSGAPLSGVELRLGTFRAATNELGIARLEVPSGTYNAVTWKMRYEVVSQTVAISSDTIIQLELPAAREPEQPYWM